MKIFKIILYVLTALLSIFLCFGVYVSDKSLDTSVDVGLLFSVILSVIAIAAMIIFPIAYMISHPESAKRSLIGLGILAVVFGLSYMVSGNEILLSYEKVGFTSPTYSKLVGAGLIMMYLMTLLIIVASVYGEVRKFFK